MDVSESGNEKPAETLPSETKKVYDAPILTVFGDMTDITQGPSIFGTDDGAFGFIS